MYKTPGEEIKSNASLLTVLSSLPAVLSGIAVILFVGEWLGWLLGLVIMVVGVWMARLFGSVMYGFGVIVDRIDHLDSRYFTERATHAVETDVMEEDTMENAEGPIVVQLRKDRTWECPFCERINGAKRTECQNCGVLVRFSE